MSYDIDITKTPPAHEPERQYYYLSLIHISEPTRP